MNKDKQARKEINLFHCGTGCSRWKEAESDPKDKDSLIICVLMRIWASSWISTAFISLGVNCSKIGIEIHIFGLRPCIEKAAGIDFSVK